MFPTPTEAAISPSPGVDYEKKIDLQDQLSVDFGRHRSGWSYAIQDFKALHNAKGVLFDAFIERTFYWHFLGIKPHLRPWIGFIHVPPAAPAWFSRNQTNDDIFNSPAWKESLPYCRGLFTLSNYHKQNLEKKLTIPIDNLLFPAEFPPTTWDADRFAANREKKIVQVGWWLRKLHAIYQLPTSPVLYKKLFLSVGHELLPELLRIERDILIKEGSFVDSMYETAQTISYLADHRYDELLSENIVFVNLYDASGNNTVIECIARNAPILINPLEAVKEYLGDGYPLYYDSLEEAAEKAADFDLVYKAHRYLVDNPIKAKLTRRFFLESFVQSPIYCNL